MKNQSQLLPLMNRGQNVSAHQTQSHLKKGQKKASCP